MATKPAKKSVKKPATTKKPVAKKPAAKAAKKAAPKKAAPAPKRGKRVGKEAAAQAAE